MDEEPGSLFGKFIGSLTRAVILSVGVTLVNKGLSNQLIVNEFATVSGELAVGVATAGFAVVWSLVQKATEHGKLVAANDVNKQLVEEKKP